VIDEKIKEAVNVVNREFSEEFLKGGATITASEYI